MQENDERKRRRTDLHVDEVGQGSDAADLRARTMEPFLPVILAIHGLAVLNTGPGWAWIILELLVAVAAISLLLRQGRNRRARHRYSVNLRAGLVTFAAFGFIAATGGTASPFFLWLFAIVAIYPLLLKPGMSLAISFSVAVGYVLMAFIPASTLPWLELAARAGLLLFVGLVVHNFGIRLKSYEHVRNLANIDELTGVFNRRHFFERASFEYARCQRQGSALTVALFDLNDFKRINDTCGHALGDECLRRFARVLISRAGKADIVARLGGDEFVVLMPESRIKGAAELIRRVRSKLRRDPIESQFGDLNLKTCAGVSTMTMSTQGLEALLENADRDLYRAKDRLDSKHMRDRRRHLQVA